jgi:hypothetical protein
VKPENARGIRGAIWAGEEHIEGREIFICGGRGIDGPEVVGWKPG